MSIKVHKNFISSFTQDFLKVEDLNKEILTIPRNAEKLLEGLFNRDQILNRFLARQGVPKNLRPAEALKWEAQAEAAIRHSIRTAYNQANLPTPADTALYKGEALNNATLFNKLVKESKKVGRMDLSQVQFGLFSAQQLENYSYKLPVGMYRSGKNAIVPSGPLGDEFRNVIDALRGRGFEFSPVSREVDEKAYRLLGYNIKGPGQYRPTFLPILGGVNSKGGITGVYYNKFGKTQGVAVGTILRGTNGQALDPVRSDLAALRAMLEEFENADINGLTQAQTARERSSKAFEGLNKILEKAYIDDPNLYQRARRANMALADPRLIGRDAEAFDRMIVRGAGGWLGMSSSDLAEKHMFRMSDEFIAEKFHKGGVSHGPKSSQIFKGSWTAESIIKARKAGLKVKEGSFFISDVIASGGSPHRAATMPIFYAQQEHAQRVLKGFGLPAFLGDEDMLLMHPAFRKLEKSEMMFRHLLGGESPVNTKIGLMINSLENQFGAEEVRGAMRRGNLGKLIEDFRKHTGDKDFGKFGANEFLGFSPNNRAEAITTVSAGHSFIDDIVVDTSGEISLSVRNVTRGLPGGKVYFDLGKATIGGSPGLLGKFLTYSVTKEGRNYQFNGSVIDFVSASIAVSQNYGLTELETASLSQKVSSGRFHEIEPAMLERFSTEFNRLRSKMGGVGGISTADLAKKELGPTLAATNASIIETIEAEVGRDIERGNLPAAQFLTDKIAKLKTTIAKGNISAHFVKDELKDLIHEYHQVHDPKKLGGLAHLEGGQFGALAGVSYTHLVPEHLPEVMRGAGKPLELGFQMAHMANRMGGGFSGPVYQEVLARTGKAGQLLHNAQTISNILQNSTSARVVTSDDIERAGVTLEQLFNPDFGQRQAAFRELLKKAGINTTKSEVISLGIETKAGRFAVPAFPAAFTPATGERTVLQDLESATIRAIKDSSQMDNLPIEQQRALAKRINERYVKATAEYSKRAVQKAFQGEIKGSLLGQQASMPGISKVTKQSYQELQLKIDQLSKIGENLESKIVGADDIEKFMGPQEVYFAERIFGKKAGYTYRELESVMLQSGMSIGISKKAAAQMLTQKQMQRFKDGGLFAGMALRHPAAGLGNFTQTTYFNLEHLVKNTNVGKFQLHDYHSITGALFKVLTGGDSDGDMIGQIVSQNFDAINSLNSDFRDPGSFVSQLVKHSVGHESIKAKAPIDYEAMAKARGIPIHRGGVETPEYRMMIDEFIRAQGLAEKRYVGLIVPHLEEMRFMTSAAHTIGKISNQQQFDVHYLLYRINEDIIKGKQAKADALTESAEELVRVFSAAGQAGNWAEKKGQLRRLIEDVVTGGFGASSEQEKQMLTKTMEGFDPLIDIMQSGEFREEAHIFRQLAVGKNVSQAQAETVLKNFSKLGGIISPRGGMAGAVEGMQANLARNLKNIRTPMLLGLGALAAVGMGMGNRSTGDAYDAENMLRPSQLPQGSAGNPYSSRVPMESSYSGHSSYRVKVHARAKRNYDYMYLNQLVGQNFPGANSSIHVSDTRQMIRHQDVKDRMGY